MNKTIITYKFRIKDANCRKHLKKLASKVDFVWNYCNETSQNAIKRDRKWLTKIDLHTLTAGSGRELGLHSRSIQEICTEYATRRDKSKKRRLKWRTQKRNLGWIPLGYSFKLRDNTFIYGKKKYRIWLHRLIEGSIKTATLTEDSRGRWYICIQSEIDCLPIPQSQNSIGIDLGLKTNVTCSNGTKYSRKNLTKYYEKKLASAQRAHKKKLVKTIHAKIVNTRRDWNHKVSTEILKGAQKVVIGDVSSSKLIRTRLAKSVSDVAWSQLRSMFVYKAKKLGVDVKIINENYSTLTCSDCLSRSGPRGKAGLSVREWVCTVCGSLHDRDVNAARNILRMELHPPVGSPSLSRN